MKKNKLIYIGIIFGIVIILFYMMPVFYIQSVEVVDNHFYKKEEIIEASGLKNQNFLDLDYFSAKKNIKKLSYVSNVKLSYKFPGKIIIYITEKAPFAYVQFNGTYLCINSKGQVIEQTQKKYHEIPVIDGLEFSSFKNSETLPVTNENTWLVAQEVIDKLDKFEYTSKVQKIDVHNIKEIHLYVDKLDVIMGDIVDFDKKIETLIAIHDKEGYTMGILDVSVVNTKLEAAYLKPIT